MPVILVLAHVMLVIVIWSLGQTPTRAPMPKRIPTPGWSMWPALDCDADSSCPTVCAVTRCESTKKSAAASPSLWSMSDPTPHRPGSSIWPKKKAARFLLPGQPRSPLQHIRGAASPGIVHTTPTYLSAESSRSGQDFLESDVNHK